MTVTIRHGDCREILRTLPDESVNCCVTSPPYFGLRDYGVAGQIGLEPTPEEFVDELVSVFRDVRRVLRADGTLWLNLGDSYAGSGRGGNPTEETSTLQGGHASQRASMIVRTRPIGATAREAAVTQRGSRLPAGFHEGVRQAGNIGRAWVPPPLGLKQKDLIGTPWMVAFALRADGWYLRQDIIWHKPNPMPESVQDRCTKAHEYLFLLSKSERYYLDNDALQEPVESNKGNATTFRGGAYVNNSTFDNGQGGKRTAKGNHGRAAGNKSHKYVDAYDASETEEHRTKAGLMKVADTACATRNKRSVWTVATKPFKEAHFATFPPALVEPCILAGSPAGGTVLDPFGGAGTTGLVASRHSRNAILIELNPEYAAIADRRIRGDAGMLADIDVS